MCLGDERFEVSSLGSCSRRLDIEHVPSDIAANGPEERRDTSPPTPLNLATTSPAPGSQPRKTLLRNTLRNTPARPGYNDRRAELRVHHTPTRTNNLFARANHVNPSPVHVGLRARDAQESDQDVPAFTPLPPPRLFIHDHRIPYSLRTGQLFHPDPHLSPIPPALRVSQSPPTWSSVFRARQHASPIRSVLATTQSSDYQPDARIEAWLENVRPNHVEIDDISSSPGNLQPSQERRDSVTEPEDRHASSQRSFRLDHPARAPAAFLTTSSCEDLHHLPPRRTCNANDPAGWADYGPSSRFLEDPYRDQTDRTSQPTPRRPPPSLFRGSKPNFPRPSAIPALQTRLARSIPSSPCHTSPTSSPRLPGTASTPARPPPPHHGSSEPASSPVHVVDGSPGWWWRWHRATTSPNDGDNGAVAQRSSSLSSPLAPPPQPCITLSPPPPSLQPPHAPPPSPPRLVHPSPPSPSPATPVVVRRRPRQTSPAPPPPSPVADAGDRVAPPPLPVTPRRAARKSRFGGGAGTDGDGEGKGTLLSPDVYLWRGDSERREKFRKMVRRRCPSYFDEDIVGDGERGEEDGQGSEDEGVEGRCERGLAVE